MKGTFYVIGVGPGDPELLTLRAARTLEKCQVWLTPAARKNGESTALAIASGAVSVAGKEILTHHFPMKKVHMGETPDPEVKEAWEQVVALITTELKAGRDVAMPTLGDPAVYSTGFYVCQTLLEQNPQAVVEIVPGISAIGATSAAAGMPLCLGDDQLAVIPAIFESTKIREILIQFDAVVFMKVHKSMDRLVPLLEELDLLDKAVLVERTSMTDQRVRRDLKAAMGEKLHYFSTMIVRKL
ncbi:precorrin-2 C20-methyltransferase; cobalt-factor II C20-methyltransferase [Candidatus Electrothrix marina]|uniref:Precorrin-2 C20-methyltransferase n=1 Tax=Candidatus Electrothrix marina TaxID=1859130 RepID=A0A444JDP5_9BACT|nr:precorrin-2 C20-methyltransferase; cobalt-factor II C20-methyltransferase [Candidatus Electrothrix marina]